MKKTGLFITIAAILLISCKKDDKCPYTESSVSASAAERTNITDYLAANSLTATQHTSGVFYAITDSGTGTSPNVCSGITVKYTGRFLYSGQVFDYFSAPEGRFFMLGQLIVGWQKSLAQLKAGGKITLYVPPSLGYGSNNVTDPNTGVVVIPANSYLKFDIELMSVL